MGDTLQTYLVGFLSGVLALAGILVTYVNWPQKRSKR